MILGRLAPILQHPRLRLALRLTAALAALLILAVLYIAVVGVTIDASSLRSDIAIKLSRSIGREVRFDGPLQLEISARPKLHMGGLHIANAAGFAGDEFASLGEARLELNLWPLLLFRLQIEKISGSDVHIRLQLKRDGSNNWSFSPKQVQQTAPASDSSAESMALGRMLALLDIKRVSLKNLRVEFIGTKNRSHFFDLHNLAAQFPAGQPVKLTLDGAVEKTLPYKLEFTGGSITDLAHSEQPWPVDLTLGFMSSRLSLKGSAAAGKGEIAFGLSSENMREFERLLQIRLPDVGATHISGTLNYAPGKIALNHLDGAMGKSRLNGTLDLDYSGSRPRITGALSLPLLDLRPFMTEQPVTQEEPPTNLAEVYRELSRATFNLKELNSADADITLRVEQWLNLPGPVRNAELQVKLEQGRLTMPLRATVADVTLSGSASVDASASPARFQLALGTRNSSLGNLAGLLLGVPHVKGHLGKFDLRMAARGDRIAPLLKSLDVRLNVEHGKLSYGNNAGGHPVQFSLKQLAVALPAGQALRGEVHGSLLGKPFSASLQGGVLDSMMQEMRAPIDFDLHAASAHASIHAVLQPALENSGSEISFELSAPHSGEVASWFGLKPGSDAPIMMKGAMQTRSDSWHLTDFILQLGQSALSLDVMRHLSNGKPLTRFQLSGDLIDMDELESLLPQAEARPATSASPSSSAVLNIPILPNGITLADADIAVRIKRIASSSPIKVRDLSFDGRIRDGVMSDSPFAANVAEIGFSGAIALDLRNQQPSAGLWLNADAMDVGSILNKLGLAHEMDAKIDKLRLHLDLHASRLGQLLAQSALTLDFEGGHLTLRDANTGGHMRIALDRGTLKAAAGAPVRLDLSGSLDGVPVSIGIETGSTADLINPALPIPFKLNAASSGAEIQLSGNIERPLSHNDVALALSMHGSRFDNLDPLVHASLPPWGPWSASGKFHMSGSGYEVSDLLLQVGDSQLAGYGNLDTRAVPPRIDIALTAPSIQLDNFKFGNWSPESKAPAPQKNTGNTTSIQTGSDKTGDQAKELLSREILQRQNAYLTVYVEKVMSGKDKLGSGSLLAQIENGRADIGPVNIDTLGGSATFKLEYEPRDNDVAVNLRTKVKHLDYGVLTRSIDPRSEMQGSFSLDIDVSARARSLAEILRNGNGHIDFAVWPENMKSGVLDIWAVNVLVALLPVIDPANTSKVNCAIGRFVLKDGMLSDKTLLVDTSRMRVTGNGTADFSKEEFMLHMRPQAKTPQFLSLAIPVKVGGTFNDFHVGVEALDVAKTLGQLVTSVIWVPMQQIFHKDVPADGQDLCLAVELK